MKVPEKYRLQNHPFLGTDLSYGCNGFFVIPHHRISFYFYNCQVSDGMGWQHVSVTLTNKPKNKIIPVERCCTWEEMCYVKSLFWDDDDAVMQLHPPKKDWVNNHPYCLHLWKPVDVEIPLPLSVMVGKQEMNKEENKTH